MKHLLKAIFLTGAFVAAVSVVSAVNAGDKHESKDDLLSSPTAPATATLASTPNEAVKPVVLLRPEAAFDDALSSPQKKLDKEQDKEEADKDTIADKQKIDKRQPIATKKKSTRVERKTSSQRKKHSKKRSRYKSKKIIAESSAQ